MNGPVIGVFDSGFGGLTVLRALLPRISGAHYIYLGDTARLPYGAKSQATIARYAVESARFLEDRGAEYLVIACNTATALALNEITAAVSIPVIGVIEPVVRAAESEYPNGEVLVLATAATVQSHAYLHQCESQGLQATEKACPLLVPLVEEGWIDHAVTRDVLRIYLGEALAMGKPQAVLLGCTHYPLIAPEIASMLRELGSEAAEKIVRGAAWEAGGPATFECFATDSVEKFQRLGSLFLGRTIDKVQHLDLGG
jgi:glutamate racemase